MSKHTAVICTIALAFVASSAFAADASTTGAQEKSVAARTAGAAVKPVHLPTGPVQSGPTPEKEKGQAATVPTTGAVVAAPVAGVDGAVATIHSQKGRDATVGAGRPAIPDIDDGATPDQRDLQTALSDLAQAQGIAAAIQRKEHESTKKIIGAMEGGSKPKHAAHAAGEAAHTSAVGRSGFGAAPPSTAPEEQPANPPNAAPQQEPAPPAEEPTQGDPPANAPQAPGDP
jgi:hypothetical protein